MITYEFTAVNESCQVFRADNEIDYLEVPVRIRIPHRLALVYGLDQLQTQITEAMDNVVKTLNHKIS